MRQLHTQNIHLDTIDGYGDFIIHNKGSSQIWCKYITATQNISHHFLLKFFNLMIAK